MSKYMKVAIMHYDLPRTNWYADILKNITYKYLPNFDINYQLIFHNDEFPDPKNINIIDISEWNSQWHQKVATTYSVPIVCSTEEGSILSLKNYLHRNNIDVNFMLSRISHFIARSSWTKNMLIDFGINDKNITTISYGADLELFKPANKEPEEKSFLYVGSINRQKGVHHLIDAYLKIIDKIDWKLKLCIGEFNNDIELLDYIKKLANKFNKIELIDFTSINKLPEIYKKSTCFCLIQDEDSPVAQFSYPSLWALSCGLPIISLNMGALIDYIKDGENGFLCNNVNDISKKMLKITQNDWRRMRKTSRTIAENDHDPKKIAIKYRNVYEKVLNRL